MPSRASGGALAASLITAAIIGFAGGAYFGTQADGGGAGARPDDTTAATTPGDTDGTGDDQGTETPTETSAASGLTLTAAQESVAPGEQIDFTGTLDPPEAGVELRLQRSVDGADWENFPNIDSWSTDDDGTFGSFVKSGREGVNSFRVVRVDDESVMSNVVEVTIG